MTRGSRPSGRCHAATSVRYFSPLRHYDIREAPEELEALDPVAETEAEADTAAI